MNQGMQDDFKRDGFISQLMTRLARLEAFEREFRLKKFGGGGFTQGARVTNSVLQNVPNITWTSLTFDTEMWDTDGIHAAGTPTRLTIQTAGKYLFIGQVSINVTVGSFMQGGLFLNGATYTAISTIVPAVGGIWHSLVPTVYDMVVGDYMEFQCYQNTGVGQNTFVGPNYSVEFMCQRIG